MKKLTLLSLLFLTLFACRNDVEEMTSTEESQNDPTTTIVDYDPEVINVIATLYGNVNDENGVALQNVTVRIGNNVETTDESGRFLFKNITMNQAGTYVEANSSGYFPGSYRFFPEDGSVNYATITMLDKTGAGNFVSTDGGVITNADGIQLEFPANSVVRSNGDTYEGTVEVAARWIDPTADNLTAIMPGGLQGVSRDAIDGELVEVAMASFGMIAVELESTTGEALNLGNDLNATLTFPVPAELIGNAPSEIPLWYFNEQYGIWVEEGKATLQGDSYVGEVSHFSFWNCDAPFPLIELTGTVVSESGNPIPNAVVSLQVISSGATGMGWTNNDGVFSGKVPKDEEFIMTISQNYACDPVYTANVGPFSTNTDLGEIIITENDLLDISGTIVDCNGDAVDNGWVDITIGTSTYTFYVSNGNDFSLSVFNCDNETELTVVAGNLDDLEVSDPMTYTISNPLDLGNVAACGNQLGEYLIITVDGTTTTFAEVGIVIGGPDSTFLSANLPGTDFNVFLDMQEITAVGTYPGDVINYASMFLPYNADFIWMNCTGGALCGFDEVVITELGAVGEEVVGSFSGTGEFFDSQQQMVSLPFTANFVIIRD